MGVLIEACLKAWRAWEEVLGWCNINIVVVVILRRFRDIPFIGSTEPRAKRLYHLSIYPYSDRGSTESFQCVSRNKNYECRQTTTIGFITTQIAEYSITLSSDFFSHLFNSFSG